MNSTPEKNKTISPIEPKSTAYNHPVAIRFDQAKEFLSTHFSDEVTNAEPVGRGLWSQAFFFRHADNDYVIRFGNEDESYEKDRIASKYSSEKLSIPTITEVGIALEHHFAISKRSAGIMIDELGQKEMEKIIPSIMDMLDALRQADISTTIGYGHWNKNERGQYSSWRDFLLAVGTDHPTSKIHGWRASLKASPQGIEFFDQMADRLKILAEKSYEGRHLVHTDLLHFNVLSAGGKISAVIDWGNSMYGDFLYDLANFTFWAPLHPAIEKINWITTAKQYFGEKGVEIPNFDGRLRACEIHIGLAGMAWNAHTKNWKELEATTKRIRDLVESS